MSDESGATVLGRIYATRFFRSRPAVTPALLEVLRQATNNPNFTLRTFLLWGINEKSDTDSRDDATMLHLSHLIERIASTLRCRVTLTIVLCDTHGLVNRADPIKGEQYAASVQAKASAHGWDVQRMSAIWNEEAISMEMVDHLAAHLDVKEKFPRLVRFAELHYRAQDTETGASRYMAARLLEKPALSRRFRGQIHLTPVEPALDELQPELPTFHIWTCRRGCSAKPWFSLEDH